MCYPVLGMAMTQVQEINYLLLLELLKQRMTVLSKVTSTVPVSKMAFPLTYASLPNHLIWVWEVCITLRKIFIHESLMTSLSVRGET